MRKRLPSIIVATFVATASFLVSRHFGTTMLFVPLFLFFSWGERRGRTEPGDEHRRAPRLNGERTIPVRETEDDRP